MKALFVAALLAAAPLSVALAQDGGADPHAPDAYAGASKPAVYDVDARIANMEAKARALPARESHRAMAALAAIKGFEHGQLARHGGELRDWDREAVNVRLDRLQASMPSLG